MKKYVLTFLLSVVSVASSFAQNVDINLLRHINLDRNRNLDPTFKFITNSMMPVAIGVPLVTLSIGLIKKDKSIKQQGVYLAETALVSAFISTAMKASIQRERPFITYPELDKQARGGGYSFPSGHTSSAFAAAASLSIVCPKWYVIAPSFTWATAVGYSRMHLGVHYPTDVLAGALIGSGSALLTHKLNLWLNKKKVAKAELLNINSL